MPGPAAGLQTPRVPQQREALENLECLGIQGVDMEVTLWLPAWLSHRVTPKANVSRVGGESPVQS